ncbi:MAG: nodulation protein NfeD [Bacteroidetes bacterium]|nr:nodulation protein NfeD [Bacteroidota bacterium]
MKRIFLFLALLLTAQVIFCDKTSIIPITGDIEPFQLAFLRRALEESDDPILIFDINTFGGRVDTALKIATLIGSIQDSETIAFISAGPGTLGVSWSAGALISFSCSSIYMAEGTSIGAAAPVYQTQEGMVMAEEKVVSAMRGQMAALAEKNGYSIPAALGMVDKDLVIREIYIDGKVSLALESEIETLKKRAEEAGSEFESGMIVSAEGKLLTLRAGEMEQYGISRGTLRGVEDLYTLLNILPEEVTRIEPTVWDTIAAWITGSVVTSILIMIGLIGLYIEVSTPGFAVPGTISIICFAVVFAGGALMGTLNSFELLLFIAGAALLIAEIFLIPGFGITGISGILLMMTALILSRQGFLIPEFEWETEILLKNMLLVFGTAGVSVIIMAILLAVFPHLAPFKRLILTLPTEQDVSQVTDRVIGSQDQLIEETQILKEGTVGVTVTPLRPSGKASLGDEVLSVETDGEYIDKGSKIVITGKSGNIIKVKKV